MSAEIALLEKALFYFERIEQMDRPARFAAAEELGAFGVLSSRQIGLIVGLPHTYVNGLMSKKDKTGGRFRPEALAPLLRIAQEGKAVDDADIAEALGSVSTWLAARLTGVPRTTLLRRFEKASAG